MALPGLRVEVDRDGGEREPGERHVHRERCLVAETFFTPAHLVLSVL